MICMNTAPRSYAWIVSIALLFAQVSVARLAVLPRDDCIETVVAARMAKQFDVLETRARFYVSRMSGTPLGTLLPLGLFAPRYVGLYGGSRRNSSSRDTHDSCNGPNIIDNRLRSSSRYGRTVLVRNVIPAFVDSVSEVTISRPLDEIPCYKYVSLPNFRIHLRYEDEGKEMVDAQVSIGALLVAMDALQHASMPRLEMNGEYSVKIAFRTTYVASDGVLNSTARQGVRSVRCRVVDVSRGVVDRFIAQIKAKLDEIDLARTSARTSETPLVTASPGAEDSDDDNMCGKYNEATYYLVEAAKHGSLERVAYEVGFSVSRYSRIAEELVKVYLQDPCGLIPMFAARHSADNPLELHVQSTIRYLTDDILYRGVAFILICEFSPDNTTRLRAPVATHSEQRSVSHTQASQSNMHAHVAAFSCSWLDWGRH